MTLPKMKGHKEPSPSSDLVPMSYKSVDISEEFEIVRTLSEGCFGRLLLVKKNSQLFALKAVHCELTTSEDFHREVNYNYFLSPHPNIVTSFSIAFVWDTFYLYVQEYAPCGDLSRFVKKEGLPECQVKCIAQQLASAVEFMHQVHLVHRDLKMENILVFKSDLSLIKVCDFGYTRPEGTLVMKTNQTWVHFASPEICNAVLQERYYCHPASDVWQIGIIICICINGTVPWQCADIYADQAYSDFYYWLRRKSLRLPQFMKGFTPRLTRLIKRILEPKQSKRFGVREITKYLKDEWIQKTHVKRQNSSNRSRKRSMSDRGRRSSLTTSRPSQLKLRESSSRDDDGKETELDFKKVTSTKKLGFHIYGLDTEVDKISLSERVENWIAGSSVENREQLLLQE